MLLNFKRDIELVYSKKILDSYRESPGEQLKEIKKAGLEFSIEEYDEIDSYCKERNIDWFASSDTKSQVLMRKYNFKFNKVASAMATNLKFLEKVAEEGRPTFLSTEMANLTDIDKSVEIFKKYNGKVMLFHTVSTILPMMKI